MQAALYTHGIVCVATEMITVASSSSRRESIVVNNERANMWLEKKKERDCTHPSFCYSRYVADGVPQRQVAVF